MSHVTTGTTCDQDIFSMDLGVRRPRQGDLRWQAFLAELRIDYARLVETLDYDLETGVFRWRRRPPKTSITIGAEAGAAFLASNCKYYRLLSIEGKQFYAHRIGFLWVNGRPAIGVVDHRDGDSLNNRWDNLREASKSQDNWNKGKQKNNTTGFKGVSRYKGRYLAQIAAHGKGMHLGLFDTPEEAHAAYAEAAMKSHRDFANTGEI